MDGCPYWVSQKFTKNGFADHDFCVTQPGSVKKVGSKKGASVKHADSKRGKGLQHPAPKLPPLPTFQKVSIASTTAGKTASSGQPAADRAVKKKTPASKKKSRVEDRASSAKKGSSEQSQAPLPPPATRISPPVTAAEQLATQVAALQEQIAELRAAVEGRETSVESQERVERPRSSASAAQQPIPATAFRRRLPQPATRHSLLLRSRRSRLPSPL